MQGLMMDYPLTLQHAYNRAVRLFPRQEIVTQLDEGLHRYTYRESGQAHRAACQCAAGRGRAAGRPDRDAWLEYLSPHGTLFRCSLHRRRAAYAQHAPLRRSTGVYHQ